MTIKNKTEHDLGSCFNGETPISSHRFSQESLYRYLVDNHNLPDNPQTKIATKIRHTNGISRMRQLNPEITKDIDYEYIQNELALSCDNTIRFMSNLYNASIPDHVWINNLLSYNLFTSISSHDANALTNKTFSTHNIIMAMEDDNASSSKSKPEYQDAYHCYLFSLIQQIDVRKIHDEEYISPDLLERINELDPTNQNS